MTKEETAKLLAVMQASFPNYHPDDMVATINVWSRMLEEYDYATAQQGLMVYMSEDHDFAPNVGQLIDRIYTIMHPEQMSGMEAWDFVKKAVSNSGYNAAAEFEKLPPIIQKTVRSPSRLHDWALTDSNDLETVVQSNFIRSYNAVVEREKQYEKMPADVRRRIEAVNAAASLPPASQEE